jgi:hypothetical protein
MKERPIILRGARAATRDLFLGPRALPGIADAAAGGLEVEVQDIDRRSISPVTRNLDVVVVAPSVPMKLLAPREFTNNCAACR